MPGTPSSGGRGHLDGFHPAVAAWFDRRFPDGPSDAQVQGWASIRRGADTLIAAPTGSGKTLAGFLVAIDRAYHAAGEPPGRRSAAGEAVDGEPAGTDATMADAAVLDPVDGGRAGGAPGLGAGDRPAEDPPAAPGVEVVYVSPLKALAVDIHQNLELPLAQIAEVADELGWPVPPITVAVRTGDTPAAARTAMVTRPPRVLVTTPESLYLLVTAERSRAVLRRVSTVIVDEIHALARDKRGSHLALTLERLDALQQGPRPQRIGLSATQRPIELTGRLLTGDGPDRRPPAIVDCGHRRRLHLSIELPGTELDAVASTEQFGEILDAIARRVGEHRTTLVFVNTRRMSERLAHQLAERLGPDRVSAHHGSLSKQRRLRVEERLRAGELQALVATASLELGIDIGPVELVCQVGSPRSIATFLQRVGRSNHSRHGVPEGILYPLTRDELVECAALVAAVRSGRLDRVSSPEAPLDILVQQVVAEVAARGACHEDELYDLVRRAAPYAALPRTAFDEVLDLASDGITTGRGRRMAHLHRDRVNAMVRPRRGARLAALTSGGAIAEAGDYRVVLDPDDTPLGTVNEDFAVESMVGDVFLLGTHAWRVRRVEQGVVRVVDAEGAAPTVPFWVGEAPSRTAELSEEVSELRRAVARQLDGPGPEAAVDELRRRGALDDHGARQVVDYLAAGRANLGVIPTQHDVVFERFFDESGGMQLVVHAPYGGRIARALGLALRKRFCASFDFELQAAANDDAVVLSLGPQHSFPLTDAARLLRAGTAPDVLAQAVLTSPMFTARWRWNLSRALAILRFRGGRKNPLPVQRMEADDLMAAVFPALAACQENTPAGPVVIPDHVLVRQTLHDCLHEAMDVDGLVDLLQRLESGAVRTHFVDSSEPSVFAREILNGKPYTFLDDAPLEERRTRAVAAGRGLPAVPEGLGQLDADVVRQVRDEVAPHPRDAEELHDLLCALVVTRPLPGADPWFAALGVAGRAAVVHPPPEAAGPDRLWCSAESRPAVEQLVPGAVFDPDVRASRLAGRGDPLDADVAAADVVRGHLEVSGPATVGDLAARSGLTASRVRIGLGRLEAEGFALQGCFDPDVGEPQWCARRLLARIQRATRTRRRRQIEPVTAQDLMRFLLQWQSVTPGWQRQGRAGLLQVIDQLQGYEVAAGAWEENVLPARVEHYQQQWLEELCLSGTVTWGRFSLRGDDSGGARRGAATPSRTTPLTFAVREDLPWLLHAARGGGTPGEPAHGAGRDVLDLLRRHGALFHPEIGALSGQLPVEVEEGLWDLVARGLVTADGFQAVRSLLSARERWNRRHRQQVRSRVGHRRPVVARRGGEGRWALLPAAPLVLDEEELAEAVAGQLLARWGVVFWDLSRREHLAVPWRSVLRALRRFEDRGLVRGGRFVAGFVGEQYALPEALDALRQVRRQPRTGQVVQVSAADPLNLVGIIVPGRRVASLRTNSVVYRDGLPLLPGSNPHLVGGPPSTTDRASGL